MNSKLPLLFVSGFPTTLELATQKQLQSFIPFMVACSFNHESVSELPEWWPENIPMINPETKPICDEEEWMEILKDLIRTCYKFHGCEYLLHFGGELMAHHRTNLRYINNFNGTTSLYVKGENKLLCTFRNENITYDKKVESPKKFLKPRIINVIKILDDDDNDDEIFMTESIDIYICENCNVELESLTDLQNHEEVCGGNAALNATNTAEDDARTMLFNYIQLSSIEEIDIVKPRIPKSPIKKLPLRPYSRNRREIKLLRNIPFSSPAGKIAHKRLGIGMDEETLTEKLSRIENSCSTSNINSEIPKNGSIKSKKYKVTYKKKPSKYERTYQFPIGHILHKAPPTPQPIPAPVEPTIPTKRTADKRKVVCYIDLCSSDDDTSEQNHEDQIFKKSIETLENVVYDSSVGDYESTESGNNILSIVSYGSIKEPFQIVEEKENLNTFQVMSKKIMDGVPAESEVSSFMSWGFMKNINSDQEVFSLIPSETIEGIKNASEITKDNEELIEYSEDSVKFTEQFSPVVGDYINLCSSDEETEVPFFSNSAFAKFSLGPSLTS